MEVVMTEALLKASDSSVLFVMSLSLSTSSSVVAWQQPSNLGLDSTYLLNRLTMKPAAIGTKESVTCDGIIIRTSSKACF